MKFSEKWLREWVNPPLSTKDLCDKLIMAGTEIDSIEETEDKDTLIEVDLTPNRGDCLSIRGIAREIAVLTDTPLTPLAPPGFMALDLSLDVDLKIAAPQACPRYIGRMIRTLQPTTTPSWIQERLEKSDIGCIHPVVDILNYVMLELGQPMHAFDADKIHAPMMVREAQGGEKLLLLNEQEVTLQAKTLVIADNQKVLAIAGIMGGKDSGVSETTQNILLESAFFTPHLIAGKARLYGLHTDSSARFERGVDPQLQITAIERATSLICEHCGGTPGPLVERVEESMLPRREWIPLHYSRLNALLGYTIEPNKVVNILQKLGCQVEPSADKDDIVWRVFAPSYRGDMVEEIDLIEEVVRIYGYNNIPAKMPLTHLQFASPSCKKVSLSRIKRAMVDLGYQEVITYSFVDELLQKQLFSEESLALANPIASDMNVMRVSLWPGLLTTVKYNQNRQQNRLRIFETGLRFRKQKDNIVQENTLAGLICGDFAHEHWNIPKRAVDFFDLKETLTTLWQMTGQNKPLIFQPSQHEACHPGQCAELIWNNQSFGVIGKLHPKIEKALDLQGPIYLFELALSLFQDVPMPVFEKPSRFPEIRRDIAVIVDDKVASDSLINYVRKSSGELLREVNIFDVYTGKGIDLGRKSIAMGLILQHPSRTLVDKEVDDVIHTLVVGLEKEFNAKLRD